MKYLAIIAAMLSLNAYAGTADDIGDLIKKLEQEGKVSVSVVQNSAADISQFVWKEIKAAQSDMVVDIGKAQDMALNAQKAIMALQKRLENHIYRDKKEHQYLQSQINKLKEDMAKLQQVSK
jgi:prefoldin subunit 5